jgi:parallel beta-helix repeat protein
MTITYTGEKKVKKSKVMFLVVLTIVSLCAVNTQPVSSQQTAGIIYIASDGSVSTSTNLTVPIQQDGNLYTFTDNIENYFIVVQRNNVVIDGAGYSLASQGEVGIDLSYTNNVTVKNTKIGFALYALYLWNTSRCIISGNTLTYNQWAMYLIASSQNSITGNSITTNNIGVYVESSSNNVFRNNVMENDYNLAVYGSAPSHFDNDIDVSNTVNGKKVYYLISESNELINPTTFPDIGYLALVNCENMTVQDLELTNNGHGVILAYTTGSTITGNSLTNNYNGLGLFASSGNFIVGNYLANNNRGLQLSNASNTNSISTNDITNNDDGMFLFDSFQNTIVLNNITNNNIGIGVRESSYNMIRGNYFVNNAKQVYDVASGEASVTASVNIWGVGYPQGGNYWSDYTGADVKSGEKQDQTGSDGLGDTPYIISANNEDKFPLMPYGSPPAVSIVSPTNKTYTTNSVTLSFTVSEPTVWTKYSLDGEANVTITEDTTLSGLAYGTHSVTVYAQDTDGKTGATTIYFTIAEGSEPPPTETTQLDSSLIILIAVIVVVIVALVLLYFLKIKKK